MDEHLRRDLPPNVASPTEDFSDLPRLINQAVRAMDELPTPQIHGPRFDQLVTQSTLQSVIEYEENTRAMVTEMRGEISGLLAAQLVHQMQTSTDIRHLRREVQALRDEYKVLRKQMDQQLKVNFTIQRRSNSAFDAIKAIRENLEDVQRLLNAALPNIRSELEVLRDCMREEI
jgi:vacuolar-type H+-ATPase subunit I/STV1